MPRSRRKKHFTSGGLSIFHIVCLYVNTHTLTRGPIISDSGLEIGFKRSVMRDKEQEPLFVFQKKKTHRNILISANNHVNRKPYIVYMCVRVCVRVRACINSTQCVLLGVVLVPVRAILMSLVLMVTWPVAVIITLRRPLKGAVEPMTGWRR